MSTVTQSFSLVEIDAELDDLIETIEQQIEVEGQPQEDLVARFQEFCGAHVEKGDRIGRFIRTMEAREARCRSEAARLSDRARTPANKITLDVKAAAEGSSLHEGCIQCQSRSRD